MRALGPACWLFSPQLPCLGGENIFSPTDMKNQLVVDIQSISPKYLHISTWFRASSKFSSSDPALKPCIMIISTGTNSDLFQEIHTCRKVSEPIARPTLERPKMYCLDSVFLDQREMFTQLKIQGMSWKEDP